MKLYHGTSSDNIESINQHGLFPTDGGTKLVDTSRETLQGKDYYGVYGFTSLVDARCFANDNNGDAVFEFEADDVIDDPEYDGEAKFALSDSPIKATLVWSR